MVTVSTHSHTQLVCILNMYLSDMNASHRISVYHLPPTDPFDMEGGYSISMAEGTGETSFKVENLDTATERIVDIERTHLVPVTVLKRIMGESYHSVYDKGEK